MNRNRFPKIILILVSFLILEGFSIYLIKEDSVIQRMNIMKTVRKTNTWFWKIGYNYRSFYNLKETNTNLASENVRLKEKLEDLSHLEINKPNTTALKDFNINKYYSAKVIYNSSNSLHNYIILNKGENDSIKKDMGVISPNAIIGYVESVSSNFCRVKTIFDIDNNLGAMLKKSFTFGKLNWNGMSLKKIELEDIPLNTTFNIGDTVISSGYSIKYPEGVPIGQVTSYKLINGINFTLEVEIFENMKALRYVYIIENPNYNEIRGLLKEKDYEKR
ncbi:MAG: rod shape-determining protein MreC [Bacteroidales bacterium]